MIKKSITLSVKYFTDIDPIRQVEGSDWIDLRCAEDVDMKAGDFKLIPLGVAIKVNKPGYEIHILPRSSTYKNWKIVCANSMGIVDESYCGEEDQIRMPAIAFEDTHIPKNTRICQMRIEKKQPSLNFVTVEHLDDPSRGGFGSTGTN